MEHLTIFHWFSKYNFVCIPVFSILLDLIIGDPNRINIIQVGHYWTYNIF